MTGRGKEPDKEARKNSLASSILLLEEPDPVDPAGAVALGESYSYVALSAAGVGLEGARLQIPTYGAEIAREWHRCW